MTPPMHLFIVSESTLPVHLAYEFAGVKKYNDCSWSDVNVKPSAERAQASLYADVCRVHSGDEVVFYLERPSHDPLREGGRFLGIFEVTSDLPFYEPGSRYLREQLPDDMPLIYRLKIRPKLVYREGVTEWQAMDEMSDFRSVLDVPWSLIYRKMKGGRACTPILPHEAQSIRRMLDLRNAGQCISASHVGFDPETLTLRPEDSTKEYEGSTAELDKIDDHLKHLMAASTRKWELQLQAYLLQEIGRNKTLTSQLFPNVQVTWIGNEVYAGAGMQSIDILAFSKNDLNTFVHLIELKSQAARPDAADQFNRYVKWIRAHIPGINVQQVIPTLIAPGTTPEFHEALTTHLRGHGIPHYRTVDVDLNLKLSQKPYAVS